MSQLLYSGGRPLTEIEKILYKSMYGRAESYWHVHMDQTVWSLYNNADQLIEDNILYLKNEETGMPTLHLNAF